MKRGSVIGNIAKDLNLESSKLSTRNIRIDATGNRKRYCDINLSNGDLIVADRIDREELCGEKLSCVIKRDIVLENPLELHLLSLHVQDINDNSPQFKEESINIEIHELAVKSTDPGLFTIGLHSGEIRTQRDISESDSMKQNLVVSVKDNGQPSLSATCSMYLLISDNLAEVPELKDISYDENNSKLTSYLIIALVSVSTFFLTFIIIILGVRFLSQEKAQAVV
ncbi:hypothetical protein KUCAC02_004786 [Chaenocephalus aceratus]|uniref:Uncharacterized protein n=1 Tax=Chaenocephalus aceratus TaxID=36190 RepID=A0ACB9X1I2_CHAAC|nr:hypothetical protein KUCAC02_004786 [Chaenocephalus aceratus]